MKKHFCLIALLHALVASFLCNAKAQDATLPPIDTPIAYGQSALPSVNVRIIIVCSPRTIELIADELRDNATSPERRVELLNELARTNHSEAISVIRQALGDSNSTVIAQAARSLGQIGQAEDAEVLRALATHQDADVAEAAVRAGATLRDSAIVSRALESPRIAVQRAGIQTAFSPDHARKITARLSDGSMEQDLIRDAIDAISRIGETSALPRVAQFAGTANPAGVRLAALRALGTPAARSYESVILTAIDDPQPLIRREALRALALTAPGASTSQIAVRLIGDEDLSVVITAAKILSNHPAPEGVAPMLTLLSTNVPELHDVLCAALAAACRHEATSTTALPAVVRLLEDPVASRRRDGLWILRNIPSNEKPDRLTQLLSDSDWTVATEAAQSVGATRTQTAGASLFAMLTRALDNPTDPSAQTAAEQAIVACGQVGHRDALATVSPLIASGSGAAPRIRAAAIWMVGVLGMGDIERDRQFCQQMVELVNSLYESPDVKLEAVKAIGNRKQTEVQGFVEGIAKGANQSATDPQIRFAAHWALCRLIGHATPFELPAEERTPDLSISDDTNP